MAAVHLQGGYTLVMCTCANMFYIWLRPASTQACNAVAYTMLSLHNCTAQLTYIATVCVCVRLGFGWQLIAYITCSISCRL